MPHAGVAIHVSMLFHFLAFCRWWRLIFLSHPRSSGSASSTSLTLTAACRWSCFFLVRFAQFCELYCPFSFMFHASCFMSHVSYLTRGCIHACMIILPLSCFCLTPLGFCLYFSFELCRGGSSCSMLFHFPAFRRCWRAIFLSGEVMVSPPQCLKTLSAACRWSCFFLVRASQFLELHCPLDSCPMRG